MLSALVDPSVSGGPEGLALGALPWAGDAVGALPWAEGHLKRKKERQWKKNTGSGHPLGVKGKRKAYLPAVRHEAQRSVGEWEDVVGELLEGKINALKTLLKQKVSILQVIFLENPTLPAVH